MLVDQIEYVPPGPLWIAFAQHEAPGMDHAVGGWKSSQASLAATRIILGRLEAGESVAAILADPRMPSKRTLYDWIAADPEFAAGWDLIRRRQARDRRARILQQHADAEANRRPPDERAGRKSTYTPDRGDTVCALVEAGHTTRAAVRLGGLANAALLYRWLRDHADFRARYLAAVETRDRHLRLDAMFEADRIDRNNLANFPAIRRRVEQLEGRTGALRPDVWRWDEP